MRDVEVKVVRRTVRRRYGRGCTEERHYQELVRTTWWGPFGVFRSETVVDREEIPGHVIISLGCFGDTGGWVSKWADLVSAQKALRRAEENLRLGFGDKVAQAREALRVQQQRIAALYD